MNQVEQQGATGPAERQVLKFTQNHVDQSVGRPRLDLILLPLTPIDQLDGRASRTYLTRV